MGPNKNAHSTAQSQSLVPEISLPPLPSLEPKIRPMPELPDAAANTSCFNSLNYIGTHPDAIAPKSVSCVCGSSIKFDGEDWYTEVCDGTVRCHQCSFCARCGSEGFQSCRRYVSIGGHILCYSCVRRYGYMKGGTLGQLQMLHVVFNDDNKARQKLEAASEAKEKPDGEEEQKETAEQSGGQSASNSFVADWSVSRWWQSHRSPEGRALLRYRNYPRPLKYVKEIDPKVTPIGFYSASRTDFERMVCPTCKVTARGTSAYVVPGISLVYHRDCFRCLGCKTPLGTGVVRAGAHFVFCTCSPPLQWCTRSYCTRQRMEHHATFKCCLEPIHPGGRQQNDTRLVIENPKTSEDKKPKQSDGTATADSYDLAPKTNSNLSILISASNQICRLKSHQQCVKLPTSQRPAVKHGRLILHSPPSVTPAPSVCSSSPPEFSTSTAAAPPNFFSRRFPSTKK